MLLLLLRDLPNGFEALEDDCSCEDVEAWPDRCLDLELDSVLVVLLGRLLLFVVAMVVVVLLLLLLLLLLSVVVLLNAPKVEEGLALVETEELCRCLD